VILKHRYFVLDFIQKKTNPSIKILVTGRKLKHFLAMLPVHLSLSKVVPERCDVQQLTE
jgi:hypothetical protein